MDYNCLIIDDEAELAGMTCEYFQMFDLSCAYVESAEKGLSFLKENNVDLILLDINLQEESGFQLCKRIREDSDIPVLFISARQSDDDVLTALTIGGDDYIKKPYTLSVLLAKVRVMLKRLSRAGNGEEKKEKCCGGMRLDESKLRVTIGDREAVLKAKEFKLLQCLFDNHNRIVGKEELFNTVWGDSYYSDGTLNVHIRRLREKLEENPNDPALIKTIWGTGYMLELKDNEG